MLRLVMLLLFKCFSHPHFERACSARQPDIGLKSLFCATYHAHILSNCVRIANVCRIRKYARKHESFEITVRYWVKAYQPITNKPKGSGITRRAGTFDPGDHRYSSRVVGAVEIRRISELGMGPYLPRVRRNCPPLVGEPLSSS